MPVLTPLAAMHRLVTHSLHTFSLAALLWSILDRVLSFFKSSKRAGCPFRGVDASRYTPQELAALHADPHVYLPPREGDSRAPCPALNVMANHGYLPRDGKNISGQDLVRGLKEAYGISTGLSYILSYGGFYLFNNPVMQLPTLSRNPIAMWKALPSNVKCVSAWPVDFWWLVRNTVWHPRVTLEDFALHNHVEHDASIAHEDAPIRITNVPKKSLDVDPNHFDPRAPCPVNKKMFEKFTSDSRTGTHVDATDIATTRVRRETESALARAREYAAFTMETPTGLFDGLHAEIARGEAALVLGIFGRAVAGSSTPAVPLATLRSFWLDERLPAGWRPSHVQRTRATVQLSAAIRTSMAGIRAEQGAAAKADEGIAAQVREMVREAMYDKLERDCHAILQAPQTALAARSHWTGTVSTSSSLESSFISSGLSTSSTLFSPPISPRASRKSSPPLPDDVTDPGSLRAFGLPYVQSPKSTLVSERVAEQGAKIAPHTRSSSITLWASSLDAQTPPKLDADAKSMEEWDGAHTPPSPRTPVNDTMSLPKEPMLAIAMPNNAVQVGA